MSAKARRLCPTLRSALLALLLSGPLALGCREPTPEPPAGGLQGLATLIGMTDHAGITVSLGDTGLETMTTSEGAFSFPEAQEGAPYTLRLSKDGFEETVPGVFVEGGVTKIGDSSVPLPPIEVQRARRLATLQPASVVAVSSDGTSAVIRSAPSTTEPSAVLYRLPLTGGEPVVLWERVDTSSLRRSPDGSTLFFSDADEVLLAVSVDVGAARVVARGTRAHWLQFSPDGKSLLVPTREQFAQCAWTLKSARLEGAAEVTVANNVCFAIGRFGVGNIPFWFSRGGDRALYFTQDSTTFTLRSAAVDGSVTAMLGSDVQISLVQQSPDGAWVSFLTRAGGAEPRMQLAAMDGSSSILLGPGDVAPRFNAAGTHVLYVEATGRIAGTTLGTLFLARADGSARVELGQSVPATWSFFSPDGGHVLFFTDFDGVRGTLRLAPVAGGPTTTLGPQVSTRPLTFSPDGERLLFLSSFDSSLFIGTLRLLELSSLSITTIASGVSPYGSRFSPDGAHVLFLTGAGGGGVTGTLGLFSATTGSSVQLGTGVALDLAVFASGGTRLFFHSDFSINEYRGTLQLADVQTGAVTRIASGVWGELRPTPDGARMLFYTDVNPAYGTWTLQWMPSTGGQARAVASNVLAGSRFIYSPDSTRLIAYGPDYARQTWVLHVVSLSDGTVPLAADSVADSAAFSPDGEHVSFLSNARTLQVASTRGGVATAYLGLAGGVSWISGTSLLAVRSGTPPSLGFQNGVYRVTVR
jgi:WD40 repeat protein